MKILLKTTYPCLVKTDSQSAFVEENDLLEIEEETLIFIYPENNIKPPFYINLKSLTDSDNFSIIKREKQTYILLEQPKLLTVFNKEHLNLSGTSCDISITASNLSIETDSKKIVYHCPHSCNNYKIFKLKDFACIQFEHDLYTFSTKTNKLSHFEADEFEINQNNLNLTKKFHDSFDREKRATYKFEDKIILEKEHFMYNDDIKPAAKLLCYKTLESIKAKDFSFVLNNMLSDKLKTQIDETQLQEFFGNISTFLPISTTEYIILSNSQKNFVTFSIKNDKVDDILIDNL